MGKRSKKLMFLACLIGLFMVLAACGKTEAEEKQIVIQTNADEEAVEVMEGVLNKAGYEGQYVFQSLGTSELGGKMIAEGNKIDADIITMSSYFTDSAQAQNQMFTDLTFETKALEETASYATPLLGNTGALFVNTEVLKQNKLAAPTTIKDLTKKEYEGFVSIPNILDSSTGWLLVQAIFAEYGETEGKVVLHDLIKNVGPHLESSGSGPIKKVQAGEVAVGFGLRHQAVAAKETGAPIDFIDPMEGNFSLTETISVVDKDEATKELAMKMTEVIINDARPQLISYYPVALYEGEEVAGVNVPAYSKKYDEALTVELLEKHQDMFKEAKK